MLRRYAVAMSLTLTSCSGGGGFMCMSDGDCVLGGVPGVCQDDGNCSYPDDTCDSGYRYPQGVGGELGGQCVPGTATGSGSSGGGTTTGTLGDGTTVGSSSSTGGGSVTSSQQTSDGTLATSTGQACMDDHEPNDTVDAAPQFGGKCIQLGVDPLLIAAFPPGDDIDIYNVSFANGCPGTATHAIDIVTFGSVDVCAAALCGGVPPAYTCPIGEISGSGCCSLVDQPSVALAFICDGPLDVIVQVQPVGEQCIEYALFYTVSN